MEGKKDYRQLFPPLYNTGINKTAMISSPPVKFQNIWSQQFNMVREQIVFMG